MYIKAKVVAGARKEKFLQISKDHFEITVREKAERNMANNRVFELVAMHFSVTKNKVRIINGHHSPSKMLVVDIQ